MSEDDIFDTIYNDFVHFKDNYEMLRDTYLLYWVTPAFPNDIIQNAKSKFEKDYNIKIQK